MRVPKPYFKVLYNGKNITEDISKSMLSIRYTDKVTGESDEVEITVEDKDQKWINEWYPEKGSYLTVEIGMDDSQILKCGVFQIDEIEPSGPPDMIVIKALSTGIYGRLKTKKGYAHENKTLSEIIRSVAAKLNYTVIGQIENITIARSTQKRESDLQYLNRLASEYGYNFAIKDKKLIFIKQTELEARSSSIEVDKTDLTGYRFKDKTSDIFKGTVIKFHNPNSNKVVKSEVSSDLGEQSTEYKNSLDTLEIRQKVENEQQANAKAAAYTHKKVSLQQTGSLSGPGHPLLISGNNIDLTGFGNLSGLWHILTSAHVVDNTGYSCAVEIKRIRITDTSSKKIPKKKKAKVPYQVTEKKKGFNISDAYPLFRF